MQFVLGKNGFADFLLGRFYGIRDLFGGVVAVAGLNGIFLFVGQRNFEGVEAAVVFDSLRGKSQNVGKRRGGDGLAHAFVEVITIVKESAAGAVGQFFEDLVLGLLGGQAVGGADAGGEWRALRRIGDVTQEIWRVKAAGVDGVDDDACVAGAVDEVGSFRPESAGNKPWGHEHHDALAGHGGELSEGIFNVAVGEFGLLIAEIQDSNCGTLGDGGVLRGVGCAAAVHGVLAR